MLDNVTTIIKIYNIVDLHFSNLNNFHLIEVMGRVSETQLQASE